MVEHASATVQAVLGKPSHRDCEIYADPYWTPRIEAVIQQWLQTRSELPVQTICAMEAPLPHQGLGSGTQMACTIAALLLSAEKHLLDNPFNSVHASDYLAMESIAQLSQRGKRSNIGLRGFAEGGFVIDHGKSIRTQSDAQAYSRTERFNFPNWPVLIIRDATSTGDCGNEEAAMFERCRHQSNANRDLMIELVQHDILPAIQTLDWSRWNEALGQYGRWAGQIFEPVQGGIYRTSQIASTIDIAKQLGLAGTTQSSWGPTVCAFARDKDHASWCCSRLRNALPRSEIAVTKAANYPAQVSRL